MDNLYRIEFQEGGAMTDQKDEIEIGFQAETGELFMLDKKERRLLRAILSVTLEYENSRRAIIRALGKESLATAKNLLKQMGGKL